MQICRPAVEFLLHLVIFSWLSILTSLLDEHFFAVYPNFALFSIDRLTTPQTEKIPAKIAGICQTNAHLLTQILRQHHI